MILIVDNYDSFVWNIYHSLPVDADSIKVVRNDKVSLDDLRKDSRIERIIISPGPMGPLEAGLSIEIIKEFGRAGVPVLGVCLGHQCIGAAFGCVVDRHGEPTHGRAGTVHLDTGHELFAGLGPQIQAARYHSLQISRSGFDEKNLKVTAWLEDGTIMGVAHRTLPVYGVQFHPESILSRGPGNVILSNFLGIAPGRAVQEDGA